MPLNKETKQNFLITLLLKFSLYIILRLALSINKEYSISVMGHLIRDTVGTETDNYQAPLSMSCLHYYQVGLTAWRFLILYFHPSHHRF